MEAFATRQTLKVVESKGFNPWRVQGRALAFFSYSAANPNA